MLDRRIQPLEEFNRRIAREIDAGRRLGDQKPRLRHVDVQLAFGAALARRLVIARKQREELLLTWPCARPILEPHEPGHRVGELVLALIGEIDGVWLEPLRRETGDRSHILDMERLGCRSRAQNA
jgi:hypothetical protein